MKKLLDENEIAATIKRMFVGTGSRDWDAVKDCFYSEVRFDMTSLSGSDPVTCPPSR